MDLASKCLDHPVPSKSWGGGPYKHWPPLSKGVESDPELIYLLEIRPYGWGLSIQDRITCPKEYRRRPRNVLEDKNTRPVTGVPASARMVPVVPVAGVTHPFIDE